MSNLELSFNLEIITDKEMWGAKTKPAIKVAKQESKHFLLPWSMPHYSFISNSIFIKSKNNSEKKKMVLCSLSLISKEGLSQPIN